MKILFTTGCMNEGGAERVVANLANAFAKDNEVSIVITINDTSKYELNSDILFYSLDEDKVPKNIVLKNVKRMKKFKKIIKCFKPDIIVSFLPEPSYRALLLSFFNKIPVIVSVRNDPKVEYKSLKDKILMRLLYPLASGFVFQTKEAQEYFGSKIQSKSIVIPNPVDKRFLEKNCEGQRSNTIVTVGRLEEQKNHELLINAFSKITNEIPEYKLIIYGEGSLRERLEQQIKNLKLEEKVLLPGVEKNIEEKIYNARLFVLSSNYEGMPNALMEAMALGIPSISTDCPCGRTKRINKRWL